MGIFFWLFIAGVALVCAEIGRALLVENRLDKIAWWQGAAVLLSLIAAGGLLAKLGIGQAWLLAAAALGGLLASWSGGWRAMLIIAGIGAALLSGRVFFEMAIGCLVVALAWLPGAAVGWMLAWPAWRGGRWSVFGALLVLVAVLAVFGVSEGKKEAEPVVVHSEKAAESCECASGAVCAGPRGGKYCLTTAGAKKYQ